MRLIYLLKTKVLGFYCLIRVMYLFYSLKKSLVRAPYEKSKKNSDFSYEKVKIDSI